jgi:hypothetical protein
VQRFRHPQARGPGRGPAGRHSSTLFGQDPLCRYAPALPGMRARPDRAADRLAGAGCPLTGRSACIVDAARHGTWKERTRWGPRPGTCSSPGLAADRPPRAINGPTPTGAQHTGPRPAPDQLVRSPIQTHGRKADGHPGTLTGDQLDWIKYSACPAIIRRVLEYEAGADISHRITRIDLRELSYLKGKGSSIPYKRRLQPSRSTILPQA